MLRNSPCPVAANFRKSIIKVRVTTVFSTRRRSNIRASCWVTWKTLWRWWLQTTTDYMCLWKCSCTGNAVGVYSFFIVLWGKFCLVMAIRSWKVCFVWTTSWYYWKSLMSALRPSLKSDQSSNNHNFYCWNVSFSSFSVMRITDKDSFTLLKT